MNWWEPAIAFLIPVGISVLILLGVIVRNRILWNRMKARHRYEWAKRERETEEMFESWKNKFRDVR